MNHRMSHRAGVRIALVFVVALAALPLARGDWTWNSEEIATFVPWYSYSDLSLAFSPPLNPTDPSDGGYPAIAYVNRLSHVSIMYTWYDGHAWVWPPQKVDAKVNGNIGAMLAFNPVTKQPAIAYGGLNLKFVEFNGNTWGVPQIVDPNEAQNGPVSLVFSADGSPAISYQATIGSGRRKANWVKFAQRNGTSWTVENVETPPMTPPTAMNRRTALAFDPATSRPTIVYTFYATPVPRLPALPKTTLRFAERLAKDNWQITVITGDDPNDPVFSGYQLSFAYDTWGNPAIVDLAGEDFDNLVMRFVQRGIGGWSASEIRSGSTGWSPILRFDQDGQALVNYESNTTDSDGVVINGLVIARLSGGTWTHETIYQSNSESYNGVSFALDGLWRPALAYGLMEPPIDQMKMIYTRSWQ